MKKRMIALLAVAVIGLSACGGEKRQAAMRNWI